MTRDTIVKSAPIAFAVFRSSSIESRKASRAASARFGSPEASVEASVGVTSRREEKSRSLCTAFRDASRPALVKFNSLR